jgi:hypothetical protein
VLCDRAPDLAKIILAAGGLRHDSDMQRRHLLESLHRANEHYKIWRDLDQSAGRRQDTLNLAAIADLTKQIMAKFGIKIEFEIGVSDNLINPALLRKLTRPAGSQRAVIDAINKVVALNSWARDAANEDQLSQLPERFEMLAADVSAETWLIGYELPRIYVQHFRKVTVSSSRDGGPAVQFIIACLAEIGLERTPSAVRQMVRRHYLNKV